MTPEELRQRQQAALQLARSRQARGLLERLAQRAVNRKLQEEIAKRQQQKK